MPITEITVMPSGKYANTSITDLPSTYIVHTLENTNLVYSLKESLLSELHNRFFTNGTDKS